MARIGHVNSYCQNRLLIVGPANDLKRFYRDEHWMSESGGRHFELMEHSPKRHAWQFDSDAPPVPFLRTVSRQWANLAFMLDYACEDERLKGLVKARKGRVQHYRVSY